MRRPLILLITLVLAFAGLTALAGTTAAAPDAAGAKAVAHDGAARAGTRIVKPARIGKARIGMTVQEAVATGQFNKNVDNPPCDPIKLQPKKPYKKQYVVFVSGKRIVEMDAGGHKVETSTGVRIDSTYRQVKQAYGAALSKPREVGYEQWGAYVHTGAKGADRKWLGFLFGGAAVDNGPLAKDDTVTLMGVTTGKRPPLALDGC